MSIMLLDHPYIRMSELCSDDREWNAFHSKAGSVGMAEAVKGNRRNLGAAHAAATGRC